MNVTELARQPQNMGCKHPKRHISKRCPSCGMPPHMTPGLCLNHRMADVCGLCGRHRCNEWHH